MKVDPLKLISGIKPAVLKGLLRTDRFDTPTAMNWLGLDEPKVTTTLKSLQKSGWIEFEGTSESIDYWRPGNKGQRLTATRLLKRISAPEGRHILDRFVDEVRAINADPTRSRRVKTILLFGSLLTGGQQHRRHRRRDFARTKDISLKNLSNRAALPNGFPLGPGGDGAG
jgi:DNA-binding PadR family transcriptional regulator